LTTSTALQNIGAAVGNTQQETETVEHEYEKNLGDREEQRELEELGEV
jgi:Sec-independent protein translocase protein TatA